MFIDVLVFVQVDPPGRTGIKMDPFETWVSQHVDDTTRWRRVSSLEVQDVCYYIQEDDLELWIVVTHEGVLEGGSVDENRFWVRQVAQQFESPERAVEKVISVFGSNLMKLFLGAPIPKDIQ